MYLPKFKHTFASYTTGDEFIIAGTGENYRGFYIRTSKGVLYTGKFFDKGTSLKLEPVSALATSTYRYVGQEKYDVIKKTTPSSLQLKETLPVPSYTYVPNYASINERRFFAKSKINKTIIEISQETYLEIFTKTEKYHYPSYEITRIDWDLSSPVEDSKNGSYIIEGSKTKNKKQVMKLDKTFPGIYAYLTQTGQL